EHLIVRIFPPPALLFWRCPGVKILWFFALSLKNNACHGGFPPVFPPRHTSGASASSRPLRALLATLKVPFLVCRQSLHGLSPEGHQGLALGTRGGSPGLRTVKPSLQGYHTALFVAYSQDAKNRCLSFACIEGSQK